jgi:hypothetical protein
VVGFFSDPVGLVVQRIELPIIGRVVEGSKNAFCVIEQSSSCGNCGCPKVVGVPGGEASKVQAVFVAQILSCGCCLGFSVCCTGGSKILVVK